MAAQSHSDDEFGYDFTTDDELSLLALDQIDAVPVKGHDAPLVTQGVDSLPTPVSLQEEVTYPNCTPLFVLPTVRVGLTDEAISSQCPRARRVGLERPPHSVHFLPQDGCSRTWRRAIPSAKVPLFPTKAALGERPDEWRVV